MLKHLASFGLGVYVGIYLDQNRHIQPVVPPKELFQRFLDEVGRFLTGIQDDKTGPENQFRKLEDDFFRDGGDDWFHPKRYK